MTLHCGRCAATGHGPTAARFGPRRRRSDISVQLELTDALRPLLERFGTYPRFHLVVFYIDETWSRELAPLAGSLPTIYLGVPWWYLDTPGHHPPRRFREGGDRHGGLEDLDRR